MWFIKFWIITTLLAYIISLVIGKASINRLKRKGYRFRKAETSFSEQLSAFLKCCIPIFNIILLLTMIFMNQERIDSEILKKFNELGLIIQPGEW